MKNCKFDVIFELKNAANLIRILFSFVKDFSHVGLQHEVTNVYLENHFK